MYIPVPTSTFLYVHVIWLFPLIRAIHFMMMCSKGNIHVHVLVHESSKGSSSKHNPNLGEAIPVPSQAHLYYTMQIQMYNVPVLYIMYVCACDKPLVYTHVQKCIAIVTHIHTGNVTHITTYTICCQLWH